MVLGAVVGGNVVRGPVCVGVGSLCHLAGEIVRSLIARDADVAFDFAYVYGVRAGLN